MRALCLSGGAVLGAYQTIIYNRLAELGRQYDIVTGISVGAVNAAHIGQYHKSYEQKAAKDLYELWSQLEDRNVKKSWCPFGVLSGLWKNSLYDNSPLHLLLKNKVDLLALRSSGRKIAVGAVCITDAEYRSFTPDHNDFLKCVLASSAFPCGFQPVIIDGKEYLDGGLQCSIPTQEAIDFGADIIDVIVCNPPKNTSKYNGGNVLKVGFRGFDLMNDRISEASLKIAKLYNEMVLGGIRTDKRVVEINIYRPTENIDVNSLEFSQKNILKIMDIAKRDADKIKA